MRPVRFVPRRGRHRRPAGGRARVLLVVTTVILLAVGAVLAWAGSSGPQRGAGPGGEPGGEPPWPPGSATVEASPGVGGGLRWTVVAGARLPVSPTAGPRRLVGGRAAGFGRDGDGAVLAALHLTVRVTPQVGPAVFGVTLREQVVGDGAAALRARVRADYEALRREAGVAFGGPVGRLEAVALGYRLEAVGDTEARVGLLMESADAHGARLLTACRVGLRWVGGDWVLVAPEGGDWTPAVAVVGSSAGFTLFGGR